MKMRTAAVSLVIMWLMTMQCFAAVLNAPYEVMTGFNTYNEEYAAVRIAIIDTGIDENRLNSEQILEGENYVTAESGDSVGHGTRIASLIIGAEDGEDSVSALAPNALLIPIVYYSKYPSGVPINGGVEGICRGIYDAVDKYDANIIVISSGIASDDERLYSAVMYAEENNVIVISAAGNNGNDTPSYPAFYPTVVSVGSVGTDREVSSFSQRSGNITVVAPGEDLYGLSIKNGSFFEKFSGTSYSCAYVAAMASRLAGMYPSMTPADFRWVLQNTGTDVFEVGYDDASGFGIISAERALSEYMDITAKPAVPFYDVCISDWYYDGVQKVHEMGIMSGSEKNFFFPNEGLTRGMLTTMLYRLEGEPQADYDKDFVDVPETAYYKNAVKWAASKGIAYGMTDTQFMPNENVTREQAVAFLYRYCVYKGISVQEKADIFEYADADKISEYAYSAVEWALSENIIRGSGNKTINPCGGTTRAEAAVMIGELAQKIYL